MHFSKSSAASAAEARKRAKYSALSAFDIFVPVTVETSGVWGAKASALVRELGARIVQLSGDHRSALYLGQRVAIAVQRGNAASVLGTFPLKLAAHNI